MTTFAYFNEHGDCLYTIAAAPMPGGAIDAESDAEQAAPPVFDVPEGGIEVPDDAIVAQMWRDPATGEILQREPCPVTFSDSYQVGEMIDFTVPPGSVALINGEKVAGEIAFDAPQRLGLQIVGRYHLDQRIDIVTYAEQRAAAYPPIREQLDMLYHDPDAWRAAIAAVKADFPKPEISNEDA